MNVDDKNYPTYGHDRMYVTHAVWIKYCQTHVFILVWKKMWADKLYVTNLAVNWSFIIMGGLCPPFKLFCLLHSWYFSTSNQLEFCRQAWNFLEYFFSLALWRYKTTFLSTKWHYIPLKSPVLRVWNNLVMSSLYISCIICYF